MLIILINNVCVMQFCLIQPATSTYVWFRTSLNLQIQFQIFLLTTSHFESNTHIYFWDRFLFRFYSSFSIYHLPYHGIDRSVKILSFWIKNIKNVAIEDCSNRSYNGLCKPHKCKLMSSTRKTCFFFWWTENEKLNI